MDELMRDFIAETRETLDAISGEIVAWEAQPGDRARLDAIFRFVHTVKGSCGFLDLPRLARLSHAAEDALAEVRAGTRTPDAQLVSAVLGVVDRIGEVAQAIESGTGLDDAEDQRLIAALKAPGQPEPPPVMLAAPVQRSQPRTVRLDVERLDRIMNGISAVVLARDALGERLKACATPDVIESLERLSASIAEMREAITRTRVQRIDHLFAALPRMVRDLSAELGRSVLLEVDGAEVELDRETIEQIRDPIAHIIRNAIDHGIEPAEARRAAGKPAAGSLRICAHQRGNQILIEIEDDGRGIDGDRLVARAVEAGLVAEGEAVALSHAGKLALVFQPGLSTASQVSTISGRGVGMDVVRANVERIGGSVEVDSWRGEGTRITLRVPLTLAMMPALIVEAGGERFAIPKGSVEKVAGINEVEAAAGDRVVVLTELLGSASTADAQMLVLLRPSREEAFALAVDAVGGYEELVVRPAPARTMGTELFAGVAVGEGGREILLLDCIGIAEAAGIPKRGRPDGQRQGEVGHSPLCLLGSPGDAWMREILAPLLANAGYRVGFPDQPQERAPDIVIVAEDAPPPVRGDAPVVRLTARPNASEGRVYRDDRAALLAALESCIRRGRA